MSLSILTEEKEQQRAELIAPLWHTLALVLVLLALSAYGAHFVRTARPFVLSQKLVRYVLMIASEWAMVAFVVWGIKGRIRLSELVGGKWRKPQDVLRDIGLAIVFLLGTYVVLITLTWILRPGHSVGLERLLPHTRTQLCMFAAVSFTAGVCEEIIFRGYLQKQLFSIFGNKVVSILFQAVIFGAAHGYQGAKRMIVLGVFGFLFGLLAQWRQSLRPGIIAHGVNDLVGGLVFFLRH